VSDDWLKQRAKEMRRAPTLNERRLWKMLRDRRLEDLKFRRQFDLGPYIVDYICLRHRLIVEADGPHHDPAADAVRDAWLASQNFRVLRFPNSMIEAGSHEVVGAILAALNEGVIRD